MKTMNRCLLCLLIFVTLLPRNIARSAALDQGVDETGSPSSAADNVTISATTEITSGVGAIPQLGVVFTGSPEEATAFAAVVELSASEVGVPADIIPQTGEALLPKVFLPLVQGGNNNTNVAPKDANPLQDAAVNGTVSVSSVRTTDGNGNAKTTFSAGERIKYDSFVANSTGAMTTANFSWLLSGPCGSSTLWSGNLSTAAGTAQWWLDVTTPSNCPGSYTYTLRVIYNGQTTSKSTSFTVTGGDTSCPNQYLAQYFNGRLPSVTLVYTQCENWPINKNWNTGGPGNGVGNDNFSVRWTGTADFIAGNYVFTARADDGINVWLDNNQIIYGWVDQAPTAYASIRNVIAGKHTIKVEYYENGGGALAEFGWFLPQPDVDTARNQLKAMPEMTTPWKQVNAPIQNSSDQRHAEKYYSVIEQFEATWQEFKGRYQPSTTYPDTRCNIYAGDVMRAMRVPLPTKGELGVGASGSQLTDPMTANAKNLNEFLNGQRSSTNPANNGWRSIDPTTTQGLQQLIAHVNAGKPALASNTVHIAVIRPAQDGVTRWQDLRIAQAGASNFMNNRLEVGFGTGNQPQFFIRD